MTPVIFASEQDKRLRGAPTSTWQRPTLRFSDGCLAHQLGHRHTTDQHCTKTAPTYEDGGWFPPT
eukprot:12900223-Prorocentrum_lima.AAC.1